jgi:hypothetical protein
MASNSGHERVGSREVGEVSSRCSKWRGSSVADEGRTWREKARQRRQSPTVLCDVTHPPRTRGGSSVASLHERRSFFRVYSGQSRSHSTVYTRLFASHKIIMIWQIPVYFEGGFIGLPPFLVIGKVSSVDSFFSLDRSDAYDTRYHQGRPLAT